MKTLLLIIVGSIKEICVKNGLLYIHFAENTTPDLIDFLVRNVLISVISPEKEVKHSNPLLAFEKTQHIDKLRLELTTNLALGKEKMVRIRKPIEAGDSMQFKVKGFILGEFPIAEKGN